MVAEEDRLLNDLVLRCVPTLVDLAEDRGGFVASHVVRYLDRFGRCGDPTQGFALGGGDPNRLDGGALARDAGLRRR
jgi:hypothetical protein